MAASNNTGGFIAGIVSGFYNFSAYARLRLFSTGRAMLYLLLLSLVCGIISSFPVYRGVDNAFKEMRQKFISGFPDFIFTKDGFNVKGKVPVIFAEDDESVLVFDPSGKEGPRILNKYNKGVYISNTAIVYKKSQVESREYSMAAIKEYAPFSKKDVDTLLSYHWMLSLLIVFFYLLYYIAAKYFSAFIIGLLGLIIKSMVKYETTFDELFRLGIYTLTLPIIIKTAAAAAGFTIPYFFLVYYGIALFYMYQALSAIKAAKTQEGA